MILNTENSLVQDLIQIVQLNGVLRKESHNTFTTYNFAVKPYETTAKVYDHLGLLASLWQKLIFLASKDRQFMLATFKSMKANFNTIEFLVDIFETEGRKEKDKIVYSRTDFLENEQGDYKITEYNIMAMGWSHASKMLHQSQKIWQPDQADKLFSNQNIQNLTETIQYYYRVKGIHGLFVILIGDVETTFMEQKYIEVQLKKKGIRCKRLKFRQLHKLGRLDKQTDDYYYDNDLVSMAYFRTGLNLDMYTDEIELVKSVRISLALSNVVMIPDIEIQLMNMKRMQAELSKPQVMRRYITGEETDIVQSSIVKIFQFDSASEEDVKNLTQAWKKDLGRYVLKFNREGGGNNLYGEQGFQKFVSMSKKERTSYIVQEYIQSKHTKNEIIHQGKSFGIKNCEYEIGRTGVLCSIGGKIVKNQSRGHVVFFQIVNQSEIEDQLLGQYGAVTWKRSQK